MYTLGCVNITTENMTEYYITTYNGIHVNTVYNMKQNNTETETQRAGVFDE